MTQEATPAKEGSPEDTPAEESNVAEKVNTEAAESSEVSRETDVAIRTLQLAEVIQTLADEMQTLITYGKLPADSDNVAVKQIVEKIEQLAYILSPATQPSDPVAESEVTIGSEVDIAFMMSYGAMQQMTSAHAGLLKWTLESGTGFITETGLFIAPPIPGLSVVVGTADDGQEICRSTIQTAMLCNNGVDIGNKDGNVETIDSVSPDGSYHVTGCGLDIGGKSDQFRFRSTKVAHDFCTDIAITSQTSPDPLAKAGLMARASASPTAAFASVLVTLEKGVMFQVRSGDGEDSTESVNTSVKSPASLRIVRKENRFSGFCKQDGSDWEQIGDAAEINMDTCVDLGVAVSSHSRDQTCTAVFKNLEFKMA